MSKLGGPDDASVRRSIKKSRKVVRDQYRRARRNNQNPRTGRPTRPPKKQGCLSLSAVVGLAVVGAAIAIKTGVS